MLALIAMHIIGVAEVVGVADNGGGDESSALKPRQQRPRPQPRALLQ